MQRVLVTGGAGFIGSHFVRMVRERHPEWQVVNLDLLTYAASLDNLEAVLGRQERGAPQVDARPRTGGGPEASARRREDVAPPGEGEATAGLGYGERLVGRDPGHVLVRGDVADGELVGRLFEEFGFELVVHFAAESHVDRSILDAAPFMRTNVEGTRVLLEAARRAGVRRFVQVSTDEVYGDREGLEAADEEAALRPSSPYAASKAAGDLLALAYHRTFGVPAVVTRSCNNYGPHQFPEKLVPLMIWKAAAGEPMPVYGDGRQRREWVFVEDNCEAILRAAEAGRPGAVYNIGTGRAVPNLEMVEAIAQRVAKRLGRPAEAVRGLITFVKDRPGHDRLYAMAGERARRELAWEPRVGLEEGLDRTVEWYLRRLERVRAVVGGEPQRRYYEAVYERGWEGGRGGR
ncbi:MAG: dTDP-glucose 4,6-dehydratase [Bacillota bacterium]